MQCTSILRSKNCVLANGLVSSPISKMQWFIIDGPTICLNSYGLNDQNGVKKINENYCKVEIFARLIFRAFDNFELFHMFLNLRFQVSLHRPCTKGIYSHFLFSR